MLQIIFLLALSLVLVFLIYRFTFVDSRVPFSLPYDLLAHSLIHRLFRVVSSKRVSIPAKSLLAWITLLIKFQRAIFVLLCLPPDFAAFSSLVVLETLL